MKQIIVFAGSNSQQSINKQLAVYTSSLLENVGVTILDLNDFSLPVFGIDLEVSNGIPKEAHDFLSRIKSSDGIILSLAEHNGAYSSVFKNLFDWVSRIDGKLWSNKPMLLMSTSPGARGGGSVLDIAKNRFPFNGGNIVVTFSLPSFGDHFSGGKIIDKDLNSELIDKVRTFENVL